MRRRDVAATKSNLLRLREYFGFVRAGHELLEQKREVLLEELLDIYRESQQLRNEFEAALRQAYGALAVALRTNGREAAEREALGDAGTDSLRLRERSIMGVVLPLLELTSSPRPEPLTSPGWVSPAVAVVRRQMRSLLPALVRLAEAEVAYRRLAVELQKTQRKVNALEHIFIPEYRDTIRFIEQALEEKEREALFHLKRLKGRTASEAGV
jgi:V/A-type H+-transporting ATPase subunit D